MTNKPKTPPRSDLLPAALAKAAHPEVLEARDRLAFALAAAEDATAARREAQAAYLAADAEDEAALRSAIEAGKPSPTPTEPLRARERDAAEDREAKANALVIEAVNRYTRVIEARREELAREQAVRVDDAAADALQAFDVFTAKLDRLAEEAGVLHALFKPRQRAEQAAARRELLGRAPIPELPRFDPIPIPSVEGWRSAVEELTRRAAPLNFRIIQAVGDGLTTWQAVTEALGVRQTDLDACQIRDFLVREQEIEWVETGVDMGGGGVIAGARRSLRRVTSKPLTPVQQARADRAKAAA